MTFLENRKRRGGLLHELRLRVNLAIHENPDFLDSKFSNELVRYIWANYDPCANVNSILRQASFVRTESKLTK